MPNRLADAASPYLRSHASNPVHWWPWSPEAFAEAAHRDVPVMVSIGYSTCHWCHVMARESFSDPATAEIMNENFVAIKVDREEHAEVDATYLAAAGAFTPNLGWPLNVFVTPQGRAFFAGTYWPPVATGGHPAFRDVLAAVTDAWRERRGEVERNGAAIVEALAHGHPSTDTVSVDLDAAIAQLASYEDAAFGGFGGAPKFPVAPVLRFLIERPDAAARDLAVRTLDAMAASPLRDRVDGGFFRYSTRRDWADPHYERMLYDNAQLLAVYALAGRADVADGIASFLIHTMQLASGGFASAQDSESTVNGERVEGFYYSLDAASRDRVDAPPLDEKVLTGWNGLAIEGLSIAGTLLDRPEWIAAAARAADFVLAEHARADTLIRTSIGGVLSSARPTLEDYGMLAAGLLQLATATGSVAYANAARRLVDDSMFAAKPFGVPGGGDPLLALQGITVAADESDGAHPSGLSAMCAAAYRLYLLSAHEPYRAAAAEGSARVGATASRQPLAHGSALSVVAALADGVRHVVVVSDEVGSDVASAARHWHRSGGVSAVLTSAQVSEWAVAGYELFEGRVTTPGTATAYVCEDFTCRLPVTSLEQLELP